MTMTWVRTLAAVTTVGATAGLIAASDPQDQKPDEPKPKRIEIAITEKGFEPGAIDVATGVAVELAFTRKTDKTCATEISVPVLKLKKPLPLNEAVLVVLKPEKDEITFSCGMNMLKGKLVVK
jgi:plastocyanin domain-containing protein